MKTEKQNTNVPVINEVTAATKKVEKKETPVKEEKVKKVKEPKEKKAPGKRGRKTNENSARQQRLAKFAEIKANGGVVKRGRPASTTLKVVKEKKVKAEKAVKVAVEKTA